MSEGRRYLEQKIFMVFVFSFVSTLLNENKVCFLFNISSKDNQFLIRKEFNIFRLPNEINSEIQNSRAFQHLYPNFKGRGKIFFSPNQFKFIKPLFNLFKS